MIDKKSFIFILSLTLLSLFLFQIRNLKESGDPQFQQFKLNFSKTYSSPAEEFYRKVVFIYNLKKIHQHNLDLTHTHKLGVTPFADLTQRQFSEIYLGTHSSSQKKNLAKNQNTLQPSTISQQPQIQNVKNEIDWTERGNVSPIKNQGVCGSCWAFSSSQAIQSLYSIYRNININLSQQQLVDCSTQNGNNGCNGGRIQFAYAYIKDHGLTTQRQYPYVGHQQNCKKNFGDYKIASYVRANECTNLFNALQQSPISVGVDASTWALYRQGILTICGRNINHGVLLVGAKDSYWKIKNSWGVNWGENGYIRIGRGNTCGVCQNFLYPLF